MSFEEKNFRKIVDQYSDRIYNHAYRFLGSREDAEDAVQEIFIRIYKNLNKFKGDSDIYTWIYRITINVCLSFVKKKKIHPTPTADCEEDIDRLEQSVPEQNPLDVLI